MQATINADDMAALVAQMRVFAVEVADAAASASMAGTAQQQMGNGIHDQLAACADEFEAQIRDAALRWPDDPRPFLGEMIVTWHKAAVEASASASVMAQAKERAYILGRVEAYERIITYFMDLLSGKRVVQDLILARTSGILPAAFAD